MEKTWLKHYGPNTPSHIALDPRTTLLEVFAHACTRFAPRPAFRSLGTTLTFADLERSAATLRRGSAVADCARGTASS